MKLETFLNLNKSEEEKLNEDQIKELVCKIFEDLYLSYSNVSEICRNIGIERQTLYNIMNGTNLPSVKTYSSALALLNHRANLLKNYL